MPQPYLSVIVPAYNEAERLPSTLVAVDAYLSGIEYPYEIIVVNDGSKDKTVEIVQRMAKTIKYLKLLSVEKNRGKGATVRDGMLKAEGRYRIFMDSDNSTSIDQFEKMVPLFENGCGVVIGSRTMKDSVLHPPQPWYRQVPGRIGNMIIQGLVLPGIWDTQCGFKAFTAEAAEKIFRLTKVAGWGFDVEALAIAKRLGYKVGEIPVLWMNDSSTHIRPSSYLKVLLETVKIRAWLWTGKYRPSFLSETTV
jgi:dolichyl-phosphate beta-glucosyltransferase